VTAAESPSPRSAAAHAFVANLSVPVLDEAELHHLRRARRLRDGTVITVADGRGAWRPVVLGAVLEPCGPIARDPAPHPVITVAFTPVKGNRPEWVVQKLTELGVDRIVPLRSARAVVRWDDERAGRQTERFCRIAREAAAQSRRTWLPEVTGLVDVAIALCWPGATLAEADGPRPRLAHPVVLVGPEGGWSAEELEVADAAGVPRVGLGPHVLRAETAAVAAGALLAAERHWSGSR
jgi:16S rRNA (uracil1498-N3)-methyltransferase